MESANSLISEISKIFIRRRFNANLFKNGSALRNASSIKGQQPVLTQWDYMSQFVMEIQVVFSVCLEVQHTQIVHKRIVRFIFFYDCLLFLHFFFFFVNSGEGGVAFISGPDGYRMVTNIPVATTDHGVSSSSLSFNSSIWSEFN